jgi:NTP pyrophosphatase (non-canonical NTP hydrolase)
MPEYPNLDELFDPKTEPNCDPMSDLKKSELRKRMEKLTERTRNPMIRNLSLTFAELREANVARCNDVFHKFEDWSHADWAVALTGEVGEMCNLLKKVRRGEDIPIKDLAKEIADIQIYLDLLAASLEIDLAREVILKFNEVSDKRGSNIKL